MEVFFILFIVQSVNGNIKFVNHSMAQIECKGYGGPAPYTDFNKYDRTLTIRGEEKNAMTLTEGESAWIQGYADFSTILSWFGCYNIKKQYVINSKNIPENTEYSCSKHCVMMKTNKTKYIALRANICFCFTIDDLSSDYIDRCEYTQCQRSILNSADNTLNDVSNVFKIHNYTKMHWKQGSISSSSQQCVYAKIQDKEGRKSVSYETDLCFSSSKRGFICRNIFNLPLNETCNEYHKEKNDTPEICFTSEKTSWIEAENQCYEYKGKLIGEVFYSVRFYADTTQTYWTGMFRPFGFQNVLTSSCLSATRIKNTLVLDPDNCSNKKRFLCRDNITQIKVTTSTFTATSVKTKSPTNKTTITTSSFNSERTEPTTVTTSPFTTTSFSTVSTNQTPNETTVVSKHKETNSAKSKYIYIGIGVSVVFVVMFTIIIIVYKKRKNNMKTEADAKTCENNVVCIEPDNDIDSNDRYVSSVEDKPENKTEDMCMQDHCYDTAEQYSVVHANISTKETEYDRVHLVLQNKGKKTENVDGNIYDHTKDLSDEDQYHVLGNVDRKKLHNKTEDTYGQLQTKESTYDTMAQGIVDGNIYDHTKDLSDQDQYHVFGNVDHKKLHKTEDTYGQLQKKESTYDTMAQGKALTSSFDTYAHLS